MRSPSRSIRIPFVFLAALAALLLAGCASFSWQTTFEHEADLVAARGQPARIWDNDDGTRTFEYSTQPMGVSAWMYTIDEKGVIVDQLDALEHRHHDRVRRGMSVEEVQRTLGEHRSVQRFPRMNEEVWDWNVPNQWPGIIATFLNVHFVEGVVERTSYSYIYPNDGNGITGFGAGFGGGGAFGGFYGHPFFAYPYVDHAYWGAPYPYGSHVRWRHSHGWIGWPAYW